MLISTAYAQAAAPAAGGGFDLISMAPLVLIFVVFYFILIRPQQKKAKDHRALVTNLRRGDRIVAGGGIIGQVTKVISDNELQVEVAEGVRVRVVRSSVTEVLSKTAPAEGKSEAAAAEPAEKDKKER
jgi:preprotein translocase subunit YajC